MKNLSLPGDGPVEEQQPVGEESVPTWRQAQRLKNNSQLVKNLPTWRQAQRLKSKSQVVKKMQMMARIRLRYSSTEITYQTTEAHPLKSHRQCITNQITFRKF
jgi:hypothetical protein